MFADEMNDNYIDLVKNDSKNYYNDYLKTVERVANSTATYMGEPVPFVYHPMFYTDKEINAFDNLTGDLMKILNKVIDEYINTPSFRTKFGYPKELEELILIDHGYDYNVPMARFDVFYDNENTFKFCELNADGSSAMNEANELEKIFMDVDSVNDLKDNYDFHYFELINKWVDESIDIYKSWSKEDKAPNVAIVDFKGSKTVDEFEVFKEAYITKGYWAEIVDPRELKYKDGKLYYNDTIIDLVYRRLVTGDLVRRFNEVPDFIEAYKNQCACFVGPIRSQIIHNKIIFKILHDEDTLKLMNNEERDFIKKHIPVTKIFTEEIYEEALNNKDNYVLKPMDLYASYGVYLGKDLSDEEWKTKVDECLDNNYLLQEFVLPDTKKMVNFSENGDFATYDFYHIIGLFMYREEFAGIYTRVNDNTIISGIYGGRTVPSLVVKEKNK